MTSRLPFTAPYLLAPMEGVTGPCFRDLVLRRNPPARLGGAFTEFLRVSHTPASPAQMRRHLGGGRHPQPVGLQFLGSDPLLLAESARRAIALGVPAVDVNLGCPAKGALRGCAGSALLDDPPAVERLVGAVVEAVRGESDAVPVSAKIRAGGEDDRRLEELARAVEAAGADLLTVHCRTRAEGYRASADWRRLARAVDAVGIPVCGNGGIEAAGDLERLRRETGCALAMVGRAALGNPWIFTGREVTRSEAARFLLEYVATLRAEHGAAVRGAIGRLKELLRHWRAGGLCGDAGERREWLREGDPARILARLRRLAGVGEQGEASPIPLQSGEAS